jgi:hypothetical protein
MVWPSLKFVTLGLVALCGLVSGEHDFCSYDAPTRPHDLSILAHPGEVDEVIHPADVGRRQVTPFLPHLQHS